MRFDSAAYDKLYPRTETQEVEQTVEQTVPDNDAGESDDGTEGGE